MYCNLIFQTLFFRFRYRDRATIFMDILNTVSSSPKGKTKTNIMRGANLNYQQVGEYLDVLVKSGAIIKVDGPKVYKVTGKGLEFVRQLQILHGSLLRLVQK